MSDATITIPNRQELHPAIDRVQVSALIAGVGGCALLAIGFLISREQFFRSYLAAYVFWLGISLGSGALLMLQYLTGGAWGLSLRRLFEGATRLMPLMALLFIPILAGMQDLYIWARPNHGGIDLNGKEGYLTIPGFLVRAVICFALWMLGAFLLNHWSLAQDRGESPTALKRLHMMSGPGLILYVLTVTFATVDWVMSIDPHWVSTMYSLIFIAGQALGTLALMIVMLAVLSRRPPLSHYITRNHFQDLGNLLLAFTMFWAYVSFSQYLIIWSANIAEEVPYYKIRTDGFLKIVALLLVVFHFFIPFALLLSRKTKRSVRALTTIAGMIVVLRMVDIFWIVKPTFAQGNHAAKDHGWTLHWLDFVAPIAIGGIFMFAFIWQLRRRPLLPLHDPRLGEAGHHA